MAIRQREWVWKGKRKTAWVVDYFDAKGKRRIKTFKTKKAATDWSAETHVSLKRGTHVADSDSPTVGKAGDLWIESCEERKLGRASLERNKQHLALHIKPRLGQIKLSRLSVPAIRNFESQLLADGRSPALTRMIVSSLGAIIADAQERGLAMVNPVREMRTDRGRRRTKGTKERKRRLLVGVDIPTPAEVGAILKAATGYRRAFFSVAALAGLRGSELRALCWSDVDLTKGTVTVAQRADAWGEIDVPKSEAGERTVPLPPMAVQALREWRLQCPRRDTGRKDADGEPVKELHYVFPNGAGNIESHQNIVKRQWHPLQIAAGVGVPMLDQDGNPVREPVLDGDGKPVLGNDGEPVMRDVMQAKYSGLHALRHFFCSWCAARKEDGGLGLSIKRVQVLMGHSTLAMTADRYQHLFPADDDGGALAAGERALLGA